MLRGLEALAWAVATAMLLAVPAPASEATAEQGRTLEAAPDLRPGEWWRLRVLDGRAGESIQGTMVLTAVDADGYRFGLGSDSLHPMMLNYHTLPPGRAGPDLSFEVHGHSFEPLAFPLQVGRAWSTEFGGVPITATVTQVQGGSATIEYLAGGERLYGEATYDAAVGWFTDYKMGLREVGSDPSSDGYWIQANLIDHGFGYGCGSLQPESVQLLDFDYGPADPKPVDVRSFQVPAGATHIAISMSVGATHDSSGTARQQLIGPDGTVYQVDAAPGEAYQSQFIVKTEPTGTWVAMTERAAGGYAATTASIFEATAVAPFGSPTPGKDSCIPFGTQSVPGPPGDVGPADASGLWRLLVLAGAVAARFWRRAAWASIGLFSRLDGQAPHEQPVRRRMLQLLEAQPGLTTQEIRKSLAIGWGTTVHHLSVLERQGWAIRAHSGRRVFWTVPGKAVAVREFGTAAEVLRAVEQHPGIGPTKLAGLVGVRHSTVIYHAHRLERRGRLRTQSDGRRRRYFLS